MILHRIIGEVSSQVIAENFTRFEAAFMVPTVNFLRLLAAFAVGTIINLNWQDQIGRQEGTAGLGLAGLGSNLGFLMFGISLVVLSLIGYTLPAAKWGFSLAALLAVHFFGVPLALYLGTTLAILLNSAAVTLIHTAFFAQLTAVAIDCRDFRLTRRGGTIGYGIAFCVASCRWPELTLGLVIVATLGLAWLAGQRDLLTAEFAPPTVAQPIPTVNKLSLFASVIPIVILFAALGACARVYDSFGPASLIGKWVGVLGIGSLVVIEVILLPLTIRLKGSAWIVASVFAWIAAYSLMLLGGSWQILAVTFISINCCGQVVIQEKAQSVAKRGTANLQAVLMIGSACAAGIVSSIAVPWSRASEWPIWTLGLLTTLVSLVVVLIVIYLAPQSTSTSNINQDAKSLDHGCVT